MKILSLLSLCLSFNALATSFHLPEERNYRPGQDIGYTQYGAESFHHKMQYVLTFDDGPHPTRTPLILDILKKYNAKATFVILTEKLNNKTLPIIKRTLDEGHIVASDGEPQHRS